jgi:hypothetical protein
VARQESIPPGELAQALRGVLMLLDWQQQLVRSVLERLGDQGPDGGGGGGPGHPARPRDADR